MLLLVLTTNYSIHYHKLLTLFDCYESLNPKPSASEFHPGAMPRVQPRRLGENDEEAKVSLDPGAYLTNDRNHSFQGFGDQGLGLRGYMRAILFQPISFLSQALMVARAAKRTGRVSAAVSTAQPAPGNKSIWHSFTTKLSRNQAFN